MTLPFDFTIKLLPSLLPSEHVLFKEFMVKLQVGHKTYSRNFTIRPFSSEVELQLELKRGIFQVTKELFYKLGEDTINGLPDTWIRDLIHWYNRQCTVEVDMGNSTGATMRVEPLMIDTLVATFTPPCPIAVDTGNGQDETACGEFLEGAKSKKQLPDEKAMELLKKQIGDVNYHALMHKGYFTFLGRYGLYYFHRRKDAGVELQQDIIIGPKTRTVKWGLCVNSVIETMPLGDIILSRYLECKNNEDNFIKTANFRNAATEDEYDAHRPEQPVIRRTETREVDIWEHITTYVTGDRYGVNDGRGV